MEKKQVIKADPGDYVDVHQLLGDIFNIGIYSLLHWSCAWAWLCVFILGNTSI